MAEAHLYLLRADLLFGKECRVGMAERVKAQIRGEIQPLLEIGKDMRHSGQHHRLGLVAQGTKNVAVLCERDTLPQESFFLHARRFCTAAGESVTVRALYAVLVVPSYSSAARLRALETRIVAAFASKSDQRSATISPRRSPVSHANLKRCSVCEPRIASRSA